MLIETVKFIKITQLFCYENKVQLLAISVLQQYLLPLWHRAHQDEGVLHVLSLRTFIYAKFSFLILT